MVASYTTTISRRLPYWANDFPRDSNPDLCLDARQMYCPLYERTLFFQSFLRMLMIRFEPLHHIGNSFAGTDRAVLLHPLGRIGHSPHHTPAPAADRGWHPAARTTLLCLLNKSCIPRQMEQPVVAAFTPLCPTTSSPCNGGLQSLQPRIGVLAVEGLESSAARTGLNPADEHGNQPNQSAFN